MMYSSSKMGNEIEFPQRWEFRNGKNDVDSSSDDSGLSSSSKPALKKHKVVCSSISEEDVRTTDPPLVQQKGTGDKSKVGKAKAGKTGRSKKGSSVPKGAGKTRQGVRKKRRNTNCFSPAKSKRFKLFMNSLLEDLTAKREHLLNWMGEEMKKLMENNIETQLVRSEGNFGEKTLQEPDPKNIDTSIKEKGKKKFKKNVKVKHQTKVNGNGKARRMKNSEKITHVEHEKNLESSSRALICIGDLVPNSGEGKEAEHNNFDQALTEQLNHGQVVKPLLVKDNYRRRRRKLCLGAENQSNSSGPSNGVQDEHNLDAGMKVPNSNSIISKGATEGGKHIDSSRLYQPVYRTSEDNMENGSMTIKEKKHEERFGLDLASKVLSIRSTQNELLQLHRNSESRLTFQNDCDDRVNYGNNIGDVVTGGRDKRERFICPNERNSLSNTTVSSMYLPLPSMLTQSHFQKQKFDSSCGYILSNASGSELGVQPEPTNLIVNSRAHCRNIGSFPRMSPRYVNRINQIRALPSNNGIGYPASLVNDNFTTNISSESTLENLPFTLGLNGAGIRFSGVGDALSEHYLVNNFHNEVSQGTDAALISFSTAGYKQGHLLPN